MIFDEAHNVEKMCEEAASLQIRSTDIALCIDEVTQVIGGFKFLVETDFVISFILMQSCIPLLSGIYS